MQKLRKRMAKAQLLRGKLPQPHWGWSCPGVLIEGDGGCFTCRVRGFENEEGSIELIRRGG